MANPLENKTILLGVTGSIAAYKAAELASRLKQSGALVDIVLTGSARKFIPPLTFQSVTGRKAYTDEDLWGGEGHVVHISLGRAANLMVIAPASANTIARLARGLGDNLLSLTALVATCPLLVVPAMDAGMYAHPATQENVEILKRRGAVIIGPAAGHLASGLVGVGRMVEPAEIFRHIRFQLGRGGVLAGRKVVVTAGGTQEPIDPVRVITNRSSGRQGYAVAQAALDEGADVTLVTGTSALTPPVGCKVIKIQTASEMCDAVLEEVRDAAALIMAAAVADFRPVQKSDQKIKKESGVPEILLEPTVDILEKVAAFREKTKYPKYVVGFAAETQDLIKNAQVKLNQKRLDLIVANDISDSQAGFEVETNRVTLLFAGGSTQALPTMKKSEVADVIIEQISQCCLE
jgi:phosphopantothenoylcysteine decarboxylase / phosphopantothenate---cysteine ligase